MESELGSFQTDLGPGRQKTVLKIDWGHFVCPLLLPIISLQLFISPTDIWKVDHLSANIYILNLAFWEFFSGAG